jgi:hypothetical protein
MISAAICLNLLFGDTLFCGAGEPGAYHLLCGTL